MLFIGKILKIFSEEGANLCLNVIYRVEEAEVEQTGENEGKLCRVTYFLLPFLFHPRPIAVAIRSAYQADTVRWS